MPAELLSQHQISVARHLARYRPHFILGGLFALIGGGLLAVDHFDDTAGSFWPGVVIAGLSLPWLGPAVLGYRRALKAVQVFDDGIAWTSAGRDEFRPWDDLREFYRSTQPMRVTLVFKKKETIVFNTTLTDFFQLASLLEALVTERLLPRYREALNQDGANFGPLVLTRAGLRINNRDFPWAEIEQYAIHNGGIVVIPFAYDDFTGEHVSFADLPNYLILLRLLEELDKRPVPADQCILVAGRSTEPRP